MTRKDGIFIGLAAVLAAVVFLNGLRGGFLYDDFHYIVNNRQVTGDDSVFGCSTPSDRAYLGLYRPLPVLSYRLNHQISGLSPGPYHGVNIALHVLVTSVLYLFVRAFSGNREGAFLGALLFAAHPVHAEAVSWMVGRAELMAAFFCLLAALFHLGARRRKWLLAPAALSFLAACLSKENAFAFPAILLLADLFYRDGSRGWKRLKPFSYVVYGLILVGVALLRVNVLGSFGPPLETTPYHNDPFLARIPIAASILAESFRLFLVPTGMRIFYHASEMRDLNVIRVAVLSAFLILLFFFGRKRHPLFFWLLWIPVSLVTVLNIVPIGAVFAERFLYLPSAGLCAAAGLGLSRACGWKGGGDRAGLPVWLPVAPVILFAIFTWCRNPVYHDPVSLWQDAVSKADFAYTHYNLGESYYKKGLFDYMSSERQGAVVELKKSLAMKPDHPYAHAAHATLGRYYEREKSFNLEKAIDHFRAAVRNPDVVRFHPEMVRVFAELARVALKTEGELVGIDEALRYLEVVRKEGFMPEEMEALRRGLEALLERE